MSNKILFVDDEPNILATFRATLHRRFEVAIALGAAEGLAAFSESGPLAVVVSDLKMPGMDGISFLTRIKNIAPSTVCILLTGFADVETAIGVLNQGLLFRLLTKPISTVNLSLALDAGLEQFNLLFMRKQAEEKLAIFYEQLEKLVDERTRDLMIANERLTLEIAVRQQAEVELLKAKHAAEAGSRAKSEFLCNMSHEIRTPLTGVLGMLQLLHMSRLETEQENNVLLAIASAKRLSQFLSDILDISRIDAGKLHLQKVPFSLSNLKKTIIDFFAVAASQKNLGLEFFIDPRIPKILIGDLTRLTQILFNLVGNAIKYTENGSARIEVYPLQSTDTQERVLFIVSDTGIGIQDDILQDIFEPFVQAKNLPSPRFQGAGLGLAIVKRLVTLLGGNLAIDSTQGAGATIYLALCFQLPPGEGQAAAPANEHRPQVSACGRILFAKHDEMSRNVGKRMLEEAGYTVSTAKDGLEALRLFAENEFDLILLDIQMPVMDGYKTAKAMRCSALRDKANLPIIAITADAVSFDTEKFQAAGLDYSILMPLDTAALKEVIDDLTAKSSKRGKR